MSKYIQYAFALIGLLIAGTLVAGTPGADDITEKAFKLLKETIDQNRQNDLEGYSYRNKYVIEINLDEKWIDERGKGDKILASKYESISQRLNEFNNQRADKLRAYVVVVNDWELRLKQHINIDLLPSSVQLDAISEQAEANQSEEKARIKKELNQVPLDVYKKLKDAGYTDMAICFGANVKFYTVDAKGTPAPRQYKYSTVVFSGEKLKTHKEEIRSKIVSASGATLENDIEMKVFSMTDGIEEIIDQQKPLALTYKVSNPTVNNWFGTIGEKTTDPYSGASTAKQVYDYTGVFSSLTKQIIDQLPDPTAQVIITDNLTSDATIENIKSQVAKPLVANVFWFHLDRKGELQTQVFLAETVKARLGKLSTNVASDLDLYIGNLYQQAGPKIKSAADLVDYLNISSHIFKALSFVLDKATIPSAWWDASSPDYLLGIWGKYISPDAGYTFAYVCGIWNGVIGNLSMASGLLSLSSQLQGAFIKILVDDDYRADLFSDLQFYFTNITTLIDFGYEMVKAEISQKVEAEWEKLKNGDATGVAYVSGLATVEIVIGIFTAGTVEAAKAVLMSFRVIRVPVELIMKGGSWLVRPLAMVYKAGAKIVLDAGKYLLKQGDELIASIAADGKMIIYKMLAATEKVVDEIPVRQGVVMMDANGNTITEVAWVKTEKGWGFKKRSEFLDALSKSLANYPALRDKVLLLSKEFQSKFIDDFLKNTDDNILSQLNKDVRVLDGWKRLDGSPLRMDLRYMEFVRQLSSSYKYVPEGDIIKVFNSNGDEIAQFSKDAVTAKGGTGGNWNDILNKPPIPNHKYYIDNFLYETDDLARVKGVKGELELIERGRNEYQQGLSVELKDGIKGKDDGGHLIANILNGPGEQINYLPQTINLNRGKWKSMEDSWAKALELKQKVAVEITPLFSGASKKPYKFIIREDVNGTRRLIEFLNN